MSLGVRKATLGYDVWNDWRKHHETQGILMRLPCFEWKCPAWYLSVLFLCCMFQAWLLWLSDGSFWRFSERNK